MYMRIVLDISILPIQSTAVHCSYVIWMCMPLQQLFPDVVRKMGCIPPFEKAKAITVLNSGRTNIIFHSHSLLLSVLYACCLTPVPRVKIIIESMDSVYSCDIDYPHCKRTITVDTCFLKISVHFVRYYFYNEKYKDCRIRDYYQFLDKFQSY